MKIERILQAASVVALLLAIGHSIGGPWTPDVSGAGLGAVEAMKAHPFDAMGAERTYFDFYIGFGWMLAAFIFGQAALLWITADLATREAGTAFRAVLLLGMQWMAITFLGFRFLFPVPGVLSAMILLLIVWAGVAMWMGRVSAPIRL